jgi:hypothetical protein
MDTNPDHNGVISELPRFYHNLISLYRIHNKKLLITLTDIEFNKETTDHPY